MRRQVLLFNLFFLSSLNLSAERNMTEIEQVVATFNELSNYVSASVQFYLALSDFQKHNSKFTGITCRYCPKRSMSCDELIVKVQAKAIDKAIDAEVCGAEKVREKMLTMYTEITKLLHVGSMDDVKNYMVKVAQDEVILCEDCQRCEWKSASESAILKE